MAFLVFDGLDGAEVGAASVGCHGLSLISIDANQGVDDGLAQT
jgi:hypothetical protein